ncbi:MAG: DNA polymerase III subunit chi [Methylococcales symbiont of Hymedesmia sp. n. MRB-2018]|nr:MAG: DNA polymerase III subunit chi [Methylococcales symbiont of Hymedesmia sp. n. MRB-2018]KAF3984712.1 MAG: DNA polymerase III subunit chi [Methylococcales symbiont of Hymedesmia sp. n. MRB-2018]ORU94742.1 MAG: DNA polymerase III subunit chi [Cycloclasticus sp. symbiont of Poecilosclerida sp. N]
MPEVSFYILPSCSQQERFLFACRLIEKAYQKKQFCYVQTNNHQQSQQLDNQLWSFKPSSFIPHKILQDTLPEFEQSILIGTQAAPEKWKKIVMNLSSNYPEDANQMERILEVLDNNAETKQVARVRYKQYQQAGINITIHNMRTQHNS